MQEVAPKALPLDDLSGDVSAYYQSSSEPVMLDTKNVEITNPKTQPWPMKYYRNYLINCRDLLDVYLDSKGRHQMKRTDAHVWYQSK